MNRLTTARVRIRQAFEAVPFVTPFREARGRGR